MQEQYSHDPSLVVTKESKLAKLRYRYIQGLLHRHKPHYCSCLIRNRLHILPGRFLVSLAITIAIWYFFASASVDSTGVTYPHSSIEAGQSSQITVSICVRAMCNFRRIRPLRRVRYQDNRSHLQVCLNRHKFHNRRSRGRIHRL